MPLTHYVTLGRSGLRVSPFCLGAMTFGPGWGWGSSVEESASIIDRFIDRGGNFIDTANAYTKGHSETIIGQHVGRHSGKRDRLVIGTKFFTNLFPGDPNGGGAQRKSVLAACEESLRRLQTSYIDLYWMHAWDTYTPIDETMRALDDLVSSGKVRYIGFSDVPAWKCVEAQLLARFQGYAPLIALQLEYSLLERTVEGDLIPMAREFGLGVTPWSPLKSGVLSGKYARDGHGRHEAGRAWATSVLNDATYELLEEMGRIAERLDTTVARVALAWLQGRPGVTSTIIGARSVAQLDDDLAALDVTLDASERSQLDAMTKPTLNFPAGLFEATPSIQHGGITVNGHSPPTWPMAPADDQERY